MPVYGWTGAAMLRASTYPPGLEIPAAPDLAAADGTAEARRWLAVAWNIPQVREAMLLASPVLGPEIQRAIEGAGSPKRVRRLVLTTAAYMARWQRRATPFGTFAGICGVETGGTAAAAWGQHHDRLLRADGAWLAGVVARLEAQPRLLEWLPLLANNTAQVRGDRVVVPGAPAGGDTLLMPPVEVSVRATGPVLLALERASEPVPYAEVRATLSEQYPSVPQERLDALLAGLVEQQFLVTALWPPMTSVDALGHLCTILAAAHADELPEVAELAAELEQVREALTFPHTHVGALVERMCALHEGDTVPVMADVRLDAQVQLPDAVIHEAEGAAAALVRLSAHPYGPARWRDYFARFRSRYGVGAVVPVLDLVADSGLGLPADFLGSARRSAPRPATARDEKLLALIQQATVDGNDEIQMTDAVIAELADGQDEPVPPERIELCVEVHAATLADLDRGRFDLAVTGAPRPASSMAGRFTHLLSEDERKRWAGSLQSDTGTAVQLSFAPRRRRDDMLVRCGALLPEIIQLGEHQAADPGVIPLSDLGVTIDAREFRLVRLSTGRLLEPRVLHALEAGKHTPPLARFLAELATARCPVYTGFDFGTATRLPYLPGVRYRRTLLAQPRWLLPPDALPGTATATEWDEALARWQARWKMPDQVALMEVEQRLPLDLTQSMDRQLLRSRLARSTDPVELRRAPGPKAFGWLGQPHEVLLSLRHQPNPSPTSGTPAPRTIATAGLPRLPWDGNLLHTQFLGHPDRWDEILTRHLPALINALGPDTRWWYTRFRDTARPDADQRLDLVLHVPGRQRRHATREISAWASRLRGQRLLAGVSLTGYQPQIGRYGEGPALLAAHDVFAADSTAAIAQISAAEGTDVPAQALTAASMVDIAAALAPTPAGGIRLLCEVLPRHTGPFDPELRKAAVRLVSGNGPSWSLRELAGGDLIGDAWQRRAAALAAYRAQLARQERDPSRVLRSLLHGHHLRAVSADPQKEQTTERLARACALALTARESS
ncbi:lantibiotic dehydratase [Streptomyces sp. NPDC006458]|uniref:lantibiotic dehydratase n=1 Tax=Streptomyces sp. NPDC006458 TaxID=3154302 RepID=UPI00339FFF21